MYCLCPNVPQTRDRGTKNLPMHEAGKHNLFLSSQVHGTGRQSTLRLRVSINSCRCVITSYLGGHQSARNSPINGSLTKAYLPPKRGATTNLNVLTKPVYRSLRNTYMARGAQHRRKIKRTREGPERWPSFSKSASASLTSGRPFTTLLCIQWPRKRAPFHPPRPRLHDQKSPQTNRHFHGYAQLPGLTND